MEKILRILCITSNDRIKKELKKNLLGERKNIGIQDWEISLEFSLRNFSYPDNKFDVIILLVSEDCQEKVKEQINEIYLTKYRNPNVQIIVLCEINPMDYPLFTLIISKTSSFYFGTAWELAKRISEMIYLKKKFFELKTGGNYEEDSFCNKSLGSLSGN